jgi:hypothetical protein
MMNLYAQNHLSDPAKANFNLRMESYIYSQLANPGYSLYYTEDIMNLGMVIPLPGIIGTFSEGTNIKVYVCGNEDGYKWIHIPKLPCDDNEIAVGQGGPAIFEFNNGLKVIPNPIRYNMLLIHSDLFELPYEIFNANGQFILSGKIKDGESNIQFDYPNGLYYIRYKDTEGKDRYYKFIKL